MWRWTIRNLSRHWFSAVSGIGSLLTLIEGLSGRGPWPQWVWILIAYVSLALALGKGWWDASREARHFKPLAEEFRGGVAQRCDAVILGWKRLDSDFQGAPKKEGEPHNLPNPMSGVWASAHWTVWPYRVGVLQGKTNDLLRDLAVLGIPPTGIDDEIQITALLHALERCLARIRQN